MSEPSRNGDEGFTLVEAIIAIMLLAFGLGAAGLTFNMAMRSVATNRAQMTNMHFARDQLEMLRTVKWDDAALSPGTHTITNDLYAGTYSVTSSGTDLRDVTVTVTWVNEMAQGGAGTTPLTTTFAKPLHK